MSLIETYGPLIESGSIDDATIELRDEVYPMVHVYMKIGDQYVEKSTQLGDLSLKTVAQMLIREIKQAL